MNMALPTSDIHLRDITVTAEHATLIDRATFDVEPGSFTAVLGANGSGKSTLLRAIAGVVPYQGIISAGLTDVSRLSPRVRARWHALAEQEPLYPNGMTVEQFVAMGRLPYHRTPEAGDDDAVIERACRQCDIGHLRHRRLSTLSGGERRRASIAQVIAQDTPVILLDEPTTALDVGHAQSVMQLIDELRTMTGTTIVMAMHDLTLTRQFATHVVLLQDGRVSMTGRAGDVMRIEVLQAHYKTALVALSDNSTHAIVPVFRA